MLNSTTKKYFEKKFDHKKFQRKEWLLYFIINKHCIPHRSKSILDCSTLFIVCTNPYHLELLGGGCWHDSPPFRILTQKRVTWFVLRLFWIGLPFFSILPTLILWNYWGGAAYMTAPPFRIMTRKPVKSFVQRFEVG